MKIIPIADIYAQNFSVNLNGQACKINIYQKSTGLFIDLLVNDVLIIGGVICQNMNRIVRDGYLGFIGDLVFYDTQGKEDPVSPGLGSRYHLYYLESTDL
jgi:hypothetical protein